MALEQEKKNLFRLIETWEKENIELAFQIMQGNSVFKEAVEQRYLPILKNLFNTENLAILDKIDGMSPAFTPNLQTWEPSPENIEVLQKLPIKSVVFQYNKLTFFPPFIIHLHQLEDLALRYNKLKKIPDEIRNLKRLQTLHLDRNNISIVPNCIGELDQLKYLTLDYNDILELPESIGNLAELQWLCLEKNEITDLPKTILNLKSLSWLSIEKTPLGEKHQITNGMYVRAHDPIIRRLLGLEGIV